jgi:hypothetical protein
MGRQALLFVLSSREINTWQCMEGALSIPLVVQERASSAFPGSSLVVLGCAAEKMEREYCEINIGAYPSVGSPKLVKHGRRVYQIIPIEDPIDLVKGAVRVIRDESWNVATVLASGRSINKQLVKNLLRRKTEVSAMNFLIMSYSCLERGRLEESAAYMAGAVARLAEAMLQANGVAVHPSHMAEELRRLESLSWLAESMDFDLPSRTNCVRRIRRLVPCFESDMGQIIRSKLEGLCSDAGPFDCLFYSYWCIAERLSSERGGVDSFSKLLDMRLEEVELRRRLRDLTVRFKELARE